MLNCIDLYIQVMKYLENEYERNCILGVLFFFPDMSINTTYSTSLNNNIGAFLVVISCQFFFLYDLAEEKRNWNDRKISYAERKGQKCAQPKISSFVTTNIFRKYFTAIFYLRKNFIPIKCHLNHTHKVDIFFANNIIGAFIRKPNSLEIWNEGTVVTKDPTEILVQWALWFLSLHGIIQYMIYMNVLSRFEQLIDF